MISVQLSEGDWIALFILFVIVSFLVNATLLEVREIREAIESEPAHSVRFDYTEQGTYWRDPETGLRMFKPKGFEGVAYCADPKCPGPTQD